MKKICLYFQIHNPICFRQFRFFDIGKGNGYFDNYSNEAVLNQIAEQEYLKTNRVILDAINKYSDQVKVTFSISGVAIDQLETYTPKVIESFKELADTGKVEFLAETYSHSLISLKDSNYFAKEVIKHSQRIQDLFNVTPSVFRNTELIYSDQIGNDVQKMGFKGMITEGAKHILGWKSPNFVYCNSINPRLKILMRNNTLSDDLAFRFCNTNWCEYPLTSEKYLSWIGKGYSKGQVCNLFMNYEIFGHENAERSSKRNFFTNFLEKVAQSDEYQFTTPSEVIGENQPVSVVPVPHPISWADEEKDLSPWLGNPLQEEAFNHLYELLPKIKHCKDSKLLKEWGFLQVSDHFYYMCTKFLSDSEHRAYYNPYQSPYDAFINYMNILNDFKIHLETKSARKEDSPEIANLKKVLRQKEDDLKKAYVEIEDLQSQVDIQQFSHIW